MHGKCTIAGTAIDDGHSRATEGDWMLGCAFLFDKVGDGMVHARLSARVGCIGILIMRPDEE